MWGAGGHGYHHVWKAIYPGDADGLYFTVDSTGAVIWKNDLAEVNNVLWSKYGLHWADMGDATNLEWRLSVGFATHFPIEGSPYGVLLHGHAGAYIITIEPATCSRDAVILVNCALNETGMIIPVPGSATGCNYVVQEGFWIWVYIDGNWCRHEQLICNLCWNPNFVIPGACLGIDNCGC